MNNSTLSGAIGLKEKRKEKKGMGLDKTFKRVVRIYFLCLFLLRTSSFSSPPLYNGDREIFDQHARKDLRKIMYL